MKSSLGNNQNKLFLLMGLAMISWGLAWTNAKIVNEYLNHYNLTFLRFFLGFLSILPLCLKKLFNVNLNIKVAINICIASGLFYIYNICFFQATSFGDAGRGGVFVTTTNPLITFMLASIISKKITGNQLFNISIGILGGLLIMDVFNGGFLSLFSEDNKYFILCSVVWGIMTVVMKYGQEDFDSLLYVALCYLFTAIISVFFIDIGEFSNSNLLSTKFLVNFFFVSIGAMSFGTSIYIYSISIIGPVRASVFIFLVPFIAMSFASIILGEKITFNIIMGGLLSLLSVYLVNRSNS